MKLPKTIIVDIDGTLANIDHRRHFVDHVQYSHRRDTPSISILEDGEVYYTDEWLREGIKKKWKRDWKSFKEAMIHDTPNEWLCDLIKSLWSGYWNCPSTNDYCSEFWFVTGREEKYRDITAAQIYQWTGLSGFLQMRPTGDYRQDVEIKREIYEKHIKGKYDVLFVIEDRSSVVEIWRKQGLVCLQCAKGDF